MKNLLIDLPEDLLVSNILLSKVLPSKSLLSLRCVCKYLRNLITSTAFINMHLYLHHSTRSTSPPNYHELNNQLVLIQSNTGYESYDVFYSLKFNDGDDPCRPDEVVIKFVSPMKNTQIWGSCNGLLCLAAFTRDKVDAKKVCLWNLLTKEYKDLPPPLPLTDIPIGITKVRNYGYDPINYGFGYDRFIDDYKIIRCEHFIGHLDGDYIFITEFQVYTLGTNTWRKISPDNNPYKSYFVQDLQPDKPTPFVNGALHWVMSKSNCERVDVSEWTQTNIIVSFDIEKEMFQEIQSPFSELNNRGIDEIEALRGYLCALEYVWDYNDEKESYCNVWMMMDYGVKESWSKLFTIVQKEVEPLLVKKQDESSYYYRLLRFFENGEILIKTGDILFIYDPINNKARRVEFIGEKGMYLYQSVVYMESLVPLNSGKHKGEREFQHENEDDDDEEESYLIRDFGCIDLD